MPHLQIKHFPKELTAEERARLVAALTAAVVGALDCPPGVVSIAMEPVTPERWNDEVYRPEITAKRHLLVKSPEY